MRIEQTLCAVSVLALYAVFPLHAEYNRYGVPDSAEIRKDLIETWFEAPLADVRMNRPEVRKNSIGQEFQIRLEESDTTFTIFVSPHASLAVDVYSDRGKKTIIQDVYPGDAEGSWILVRDKLTGNPIRIRWYFSADSDVYVQFSPLKENAYGDFIIFGGYAARQVPSGLPFERFYTASFADITAWTKNTMPWKYAFPRTDLYHSTLQMVNVIREKLPGLVYAEDAMYDENDEPVSVSTGRPRDIHEEDSDKISLSSAGFIKWIADGIVEPAAGSSLKRAPLIIPTVEYKEDGYQGILARSYSTSFSLDWTRNIAAAVFSVYTGKTYLYPQSGVDVTEEPFSAELSPQGIRNTSGYVKDSGYPASFIKPLMYVLACEHPEECYLAAMRGTDRSHAPEVKAFNECAVLFPYFDSEGRFACTVFRNGAESSVDDFCRFYRDDFIHLVRMRTTEKFFPQ